VCPVQINIPEVLIELRAQAVDQERRLQSRLVDSLYLGMRAAGSLFSSPRRFRAAQRMARIALRPFTHRDGWIRSLPGLGGRWTLTRDLRGLPAQTFREWWAARSASAAPARKDHP
jgi:L-lactate dehydrogenase complex protein LldF